MVKQYHLAKIILYKEYDFANKYPMTASGQTISFGRKYPTQTNILRRQDENGAMCCRAEDGTHLVQVSTFQSLILSHVQSFSLSKITFSKYLTTSIKGLAALRYWRRATRWRSCSSWPTLFSSRASRTSRRPGRRLTWPCSR